MIKTLVSIALTVVACSAAWGQSYHTSAGIRLSKGNSKMIGLTAQQRFAKVYTFEGILQTDLNDNHTMHLLLERHRPLLGKRLNWYYGAGVSLGNEESFVRNPENNQKITTYGNKTLGIDAVAGVEVTLLRLNVSLDVKPNINLTGRENPIVWQTGLSVRSVIVSKGDKRRRDRQKRRKNRNFRLFNRD